MLGIFNIQPPVNPSVTITSTATPALDGEYAVDSQSQMAITGLSTGMIAGKPLPSGESTFNYPDVSGTMHAFTEENFLNFATVVEVYVYQLAQAIAADTTLPSNNLSIA